MDYILTCENCECRCIEMIEQKGELIAKGIGEIYVGTIALELSSNISDSRISSKEIKYIPAKSTKKILLLHNDDEEVCCFEFNESTQKNGEKVIKMQMQSDSSVTHYIFICYNASTNKGTAYLLPSFEELKRWARKLGICTYDVLDSVGKFISVGYFEE